MKAKTPGNPVPRPVVESADDPVYEPDQAELDAYEELARIRNELGDEEGRVVLKRRNSKGQLGALGVMAAVDFDIERVIQDWGGGRYVAVIYKGAEKLGQIQFAVDDSIPQRTPREIKEEIRPSPYEPQPMAPRPQDPYVLALERQLQSLQTMMGQMIAAIGAKSNGGGSEEALGMGLKIAEMIAARNPPAQPSTFQDLKEVFLAGIEAKTLAEGGGEDEGYMGVVKAFAPTIGKVFDAALAKDQRTMAGSVPIQPRALPPPAGEQPPQPTVPPGQAWLVHLQPHLPAILSWAKAGKDPELYAEVILDNIEPGARMEIGQAAQNPEFVSQTLAALPMFVPYSAWATAVLTNIKEMMTQTEEEPEEEGNAGGGAG